MVLIFDTEIQSGATFLNLRDRGRRWFMKVTIGTTMRVQSWFARTCRIIQNVNDRQPNIRWYVGEGKLRYRRPYGDEDRVRCRVFPRQRVGLTYLSDGRKGQGTPFRPAAIGPWCSPRMMTSEAGGEAARGILGRGLTRSIERMCDREVDVCRLFVINFSSPDR